ncbi:phage/plasmid primase, P4 family [Breoghania sp. JC706]|uniref:DNA primase family protein n=1 Tax=Breoghania sp. JC706 TaxID=3117732 RepID=UPI0030086CB1
MSTEVYGEIMDRPVEEYPAPEDAGGGDGAPPSGDGPGDGDGGNSGGPFDLARLEACAAEPETDIGNGRRILHWFREEVLYVARIGWHVFDGTRWGEDVEGRQIRPLAHTVVERIALEARLIDYHPHEVKAIEAAKEAQAELEQLEGKGKDASDEDKSRILALKRVVADGADAEKALKGRKSYRRRYCKTSGSSGKLDNMLRESAPYVMQVVNDLDGDALALNTRSGTLRFVSEDDPDSPDADAPRKLWSVRCDPHDRADLITKLAPVDYDPEAMAPTFDAFLERVQPDPEMRSFLQRYCGYCLTGLTQEQVLAFFWGEGANGKSTLVDLVARILDDYSTTVPFETLAGDDRRKGGEATPDLAKLPGARLVRASEPEQGMKFREAMVKALTGGEAILIRRLHAEFTEIRPTFKLIISGNHKPDVRGTDDGIWRRVLLVPWSVQIPKGERDPLLPQRLWAERAGVLNWLIKGALDYLTYGLDVPEEVRSATDSYREESDPIGAFLDGYCEVTRDPDDCMTPGALYTLFKIFCEAASYTVWTPTTFNRQLPRKAAKLGFHKAKSNGNTVYRGIRAKADMGSGWSSDEGR